MPRKRNDADPAGDSPPAGDGQDGAPSSVSDVQADGGAGATVADDNDNRSSETMVVPAVTDEPVRCGGYILTDEGWVLEDGPAPADDAESDSAEQEQE